MKKLFLAAAVFVLAMVTAGFAPAQVYAPGYPYYPPYGYGYGYGYPTPYGDPQYDPYAELHALHYQLYLPYPYYSYPYYGYYCCAPGVIAPSTPPVTNPGPRPGVPPPGRK